VVAITLRRLVDLGRAFMQRIAEDDVLIHSGAIAYTAMLSVFPLLLAVIAVLGRFVEQPQAQATAVDALRPYLPVDALALMRDTLATVARTRGTVGVVAILGLLWAATAATGALRHALNRVYRVAEPRAYWRRKLVELGLVSMGGVFLSISFLTSAIVQTSEALAPLGSVVDRFLHSPLPALAGALAPWVFSALSFFVVYRFLPNARLSLPTLVLGTAMAVLLFEAVKVAFFWYLGTLASYPLVYGPLAGLVVFMVWMYVVAAITLVCAEVMILRERAQAGRAGG
jgi:membrane protein